MTNLPDLAKLVTI